MASPHLRLVTERALIVPAGCLRRGVSVYLLALTVVVSPLSGFGASWDEVLERYRSCRQRLADVGADLDRLGSETTELDRINPNLDSDAHAALQSFLGDLRTRSDEAGQGVKRMPGLLDEIDAQIEKYRDARTCPECIESSTFLLCSAVEDLASEVQGCLRAITDLGAYLRGERPVEPLLQHCRERLSAVRGAFEAAGELSDVEPELRHVRLSLDLAGDELTANRATRAMVLVLEARQTLERLAVYQDVPP